MNNFEFVLEDIILKKKVTLTEDEYYDICLALLCASDMYKETGTLDNRKKSREFLKIKSKINRC